MMVHVHTITCGKIIVNSWKMFVGWGICQNVNQSIGTLF